MSKPQPGAYNWNEYVRKIKDEVRLLRHDIDELRVANEDNADVLNFLLTMSGRLDGIHDASSGIWEIGQEHKHSRLNNDE
jgi:hypothetical protein